MKLSITKLNLMYLCLSESSDYCRNHQKPSRQKNHYCSQNAFVEIKLLLCIHYSSEPFFYRLFGVTCYSLYWPYSVRISFLNTTTISPSWTCLRLILVKQPTWKKHNLCLSKKKKIKIHTPIDHTSWYSKSLLAQRSYVHT